jgi:RHS repeat-associated protein
LQTLKFVLHVIFSRHTRPDGSYIDYAWNARNLLASVTADAPPPLATYTYNGRNQIASHVVENGLSTATRSYDAAGRLTGMSNGALDSTSYTLSADGRRTGITRNGDAETYGYDIARQVTSANYGGLSTTQSWNYDAAGNRSSATTNSATTTYLANTVNAYTSITGAPAPPMYDANGNAISYPVKPVGSSTLVSGVFTWSINNELIAASNGAGDSAAYQYDALGRRTKRTETIASVSTTTWFFTNGWNVELEYEGGTGVSPVLKKRLSWGLDLSNSLQGAGGVGGLVMSEELPSGGGAPVPSFPTYDAYGDIVSQTGTAHSNYGFSTKPQDQVTGLLYYCYRYYDPVTGRWPSRDPIEERGGINLYVFVENNPLDFTDAFGMAALRFTSEGRYYVDGHWGLTGRGYTSEGEESGSQTSPYAFFWQRAVQKNCPNGLCDSKANVPYNGSHILAKVSNGVKCRLKVTCSCTVSFALSTWASIRIGGGSITGRVLTKNIFVRAQPHSIEDGHSRGGVWIAAASGSESDTETFTLEVGQSRQLYTGGISTAMPNNPGAGFFASMRGNCACTSAIIK